MKKINSASVISIIFILGILVMINVIGIRFFIRADLTSGNIYSLSKASKNIVSSIEDNLLIKAYFSPNLPGQFGGIERYLRDMLEDYRAYSRGHIEYEFIDPGSEKALESEAQSFSIPPRQVQTVSDDKIEVKKVYMGVVFIYGDKRETIPVIGSSSNLEYEITSLIHRLTAKRQLVIGITSTGSQEQRVTTQQLYEALGRNYDVQPLDLDAPIDMTYDGVLIVAPIKPFTEWQLFNLDQYVIGGGKIAMFMNSYAASMQQQMAAAINLNVNGFLNNYGLGLGEDLLIDAQAGMVSVQRQSGFIKFMEQIRFYYLPIISTFNKENVITRNLQQVQTFFPSSVDTSLAMGKGFEVETLMFTSELSGRRTGPSVYLEAGRQMTKADFPNKNIPLAAIVKGNFSSYFAESGPPKKPVNTEGVEGEEVKDGEYEGPFTAEAESENRILLVGDGNMVLDQFVQDPRMLMFAQNAADWLLQSEDLISIRSKNIPAKPLKQIEASMVRNLIKWSNRIGPVILAIIFGIVLWQIRRIRNKALMTG